MLSAISSKAEKIPCICFGFLSVERVGSEPALKFSFEADRTVPDVLIRLNQKGPDFLSLAGKISKQVVHQPVSTA